MAPFILSELVAGEYLTDVYLSRLEIASSDVFIMMVARFQTKTPLLRSVDLATLHCRCVCDWSTDKLATELYPSANNHEATSCPITRSP